MNAQHAIQFSINMGEQIVQSYLSDLTDAELLHRPAPGCNHINWQVGHLIVAEYSLVTEALPGALPSLPAGFAEKYTKETSTSDNASAFCSKEELLAIHKTQRAATLAALAKTTDAELDKPLKGWTPDVGSMFTGAASAHWLMHVGQWAVVRRQLGRPPLF